MGKSSKDDSDKKKDEKSASKKDADEKSYSTMDEQSYKSDKKDDKKRHKRLSSKAKEADEEEILGPPPDLNEYQMQAVLRIQRSFRNRSARKLAKKERNWKIFNDLDIQDEAEMLELAVFLQTLMDAVPGTGERKEDIAWDEEAFDLDAISFSEAREVHENLDNFTLPKGSITENMCAQIVDLYRQGGKLSGKSVHKVLRFAYRKFKEVSNITYVPIEEGQSVTVVGDLHGQLPDLLYILEHSGFPSSRNKYIFNGDFVDRGPQGLEIIVILLALMVALPDSVFLNRGNHEDAAICSVYGFKSECISKYDDLTFGMFTEVFRWMPLFTILNDEVFVVHGGLYHCDNVKIDDLAEIDRINYVPKPHIAFPECTEGLSDDDYRKEWLKQLQRDSLWSDPQIINGRDENPRGAGVVFGPDITHRFLDDNNMRMVVRSHECVPDGWNLPYEGDDAGILGTIFSASNYGNSANLGAYLKFSFQKQKDSIKVPNGNLFYQVKTYSTSDAETSLDATTYTSLTELIVKKRGPLQVELAKVSDDNGLVTRADWASVMNQVTDIQVRWMAIFDLVVADECIRDNKVDYELFLDSFHAQSESNSRLKGENAGNEMMDALYANRQKLQAIFTFFDSDGNGLISREEFQKGCEFLNENLPSDQQLHNFDHMLDLVDLDSNGQVDINEFFEVFRILDAKDGTIDGVINIGRKSNK